MRTQLFFTLGTLIWISVAGCGDDAKSEMSREEFCQAWGKAACSDETVSVCQATDADACRLKQQAFCQKLVPSEGFSARNADACLAAVGVAYKDADLSAAELSTVLRLGAPCNTLVRGPRNEGQTCNADADCHTPEGYFCVVKGGSPEGTCQIPRPKQPGLSCSAAQDTCTEGFYCNDQNCIESKAIGQACSTQTECGATGYCSDNLECAARLSVASPCKSDHECLSGVCFENTEGALECLDRLRLSRSDPACDNLR